MPRDLLRPARRQLDKRLMEFTGLRITWDPEGAADDQTFDYTNGGVSRPWDDDIWVYDERTLGDGGRPLKHSSGLGGKGYLGAMSGIRSVGLQLADGANMAEAPYVGCIPLDAPNLMGVGAVVTVAFAEFPYSDPGLVDREFTVKSVQYGALQPARIFLAEERVRTGD